MATLSHQLEYMVAVAGVKLAQALSPKAADRAGMFFGSVAHRLMGGRRRIALDNLRNALGDSLSEREIDLTVKKVFQNVGRTLMEYARFDKMGSEGVRKIIVDGSGRRLLERVLDEGRGGIIVIAHFGNWELLAAWAASQGFPVDILVATQHNPKVDRMITGFRERMGARLLKLPSSVRQVFKSLKANRFVIIAGDQHSPSGHIVMDFFGRPAAAARGPALFAVKCGCPMIPLLLRRERFDRHILVSRESIYPPGSGDEEADIHKMTTVWNAFLEDSIRRYPDQWLWTHRRWKLPETPQPGGSSDVQDTSPLS